jgi:hypothetical protein
MDVLYYSNNCKHCQKLLAHLAKLGLLEKYNFVCIDRRSVDPNTRQITVTLDRGVKTTLPPNVSRVPTLLLVNQKYTAVIGDDIYSQIESKNSPDPNNLAYENGGEPVGYIMSPSSGGVNIVSETYTIYNAPPEELAGKGNGRTRQMYNYASAKVDPASIPTPQNEMTSKSNAIEDTTVPGMMNATRGMFAKNVELTEGGIRSASQAVETPNALPHSFRRQNPNTAISNEVVNYTGQKQPEFSSTSYNAYSIPGVMYNTGQVVVPELQRPPPYRHSKISNDVTLDSLQQKRNLEIQNSLPQISQQLNQAILPEISNIQPPERDQFRSNPKFSDLPPKLNADDSHRILSGKQYQQTNEINYL